MQHEIDCQARKFDLQRDLAWVNREAWMFEQTRTRPRIRTAVARALFILASRLTSRIEHLADQPHTV